jgi:uncharacterized protein YbjQ (UPF0145 family)
MLSIEEIKTKYGHMASFAIWQKIDKNQKSKYGVGDISHFDDTENLKINRNIILVGLNLSGKGSVDKPFSNFHNPKSTSQDYKIRFAIQDSIFSGAYMTDIIKDYEEVMSGKVMKYLRENPNVKKENIISFETELKDIGANNPIIIAFGNDAFNILNELKDKYKIFKVPHYSSSISKEKLREAFDEISKLL